MQKISTCSLFKFYKFEDFKTKTSLKFFYIQSSFHESAIAIIFRKNVRKNLNLPYFCIDLTGQFYL